MTREIELPFSIDILYIFKVRSYKHNTNISYLLHIYTDL